MDYKILEILLNIQKDSKEIKASQKKKKLEFKMNDGFETQEIMFGQLINKVNKVEVDVIKIKKNLEHREIK